MALTLHHGGATLLEMVVTSVEVVVVTAIAPSDVAVDAARAIALDEGAAPNPGVKVRDPGADKAPNKAEGERAW